MRHAQIPHARRRSIRFVTTLMMLLTLVFVLPAQAFAHTLGTSHVELTIRHDGVALEVNAIPDLVSIATGSEVGVQSDAALVAYFESHTRLADGNGALAVAFDAPTYEQIHGTEYLVLRGEATPTSGAIEGSITLEYDAVSHRDPDHRIYVALVSDVRNGHAIEGEPEVIAVMDGHRTSVELERSGASGWTGFVTMAGLGAAHIAEGYDHMLFLLVLAVAAPLVMDRPGRRWAREPRSIRDTTIGAVLIVTAFTIGHMITLAAVSFGFVSFPSVAVELVVATSIAVAALHVIRPLAPGGELWMGGLFGLAHGTAFATTILDLNLGVAGTWGAVLGFSIGVELAQVLLLVLFLPLIILMARSAYAVPARNLVAGFSMLAALAWIWAILSGTESVFTPFFDGIAGSPVVSYVLLAIAAVSVWWFGRQPVPNRQEHSHTVDEPDVPAKPRDVVEAVPTP